MVKTLPLVLFAIGIIIGNAYLSIDDYDAVASDNSAESAETNSGALLRAMQAANTGDDKIVLVPADQTYYIDAVYFNDIHFVELKIEGILIVNANMQTWHETQSAFYFVYCNNIKISGSGLIYGQGWDWWNYVISTNKDIRPLALIDVRVCYNLIIEGIRLIDSPQYYIYLYDLRDVIVRNVTIVSNAVSILTGETTFPINTEGIAVCATNVTMYNLLITTYDDAIAIKPCKSSMKLCKCSSNIYIDNVEVYHGIGLSIGSIQASSSHTCVSNVTYNNIRMHRPFRGIFIKTYPGGYGSGEISNIVYSNIHMKNTLWWPIYIGPQSAQTPDEVDIRCTQYPAYPVCETQAEISISNIQLINVYAEASLTYYNSPGVVLCDPSNPCRNVTFDNVRVTQAQPLTSLESYTLLEKMIFSRYVADTTTDYYWRYLVDNVYGTARCTYPVFQQTLPIPENNPSDSPTTAPSHFASITRQTCPTGEPEPSPDDADAKSKSARSAQLKQMGIILIGLTVCIFGLSAVSILIRVGWRRVFGGRYPAKEDLSTGHSTHNRLLELGSGQHSQDEQ